MSAVLGAGRGLPEHLPDSARFHPLGTRAPLLQRLLSAVGRLDHASLASYRAEAGADSVYAEAVSLAVRELGDDRRSCRREFNRQLDETLPPALWQSDGHLALTRAGLGLLVADRASIYATRALIHDASQLLGADIEAWL